MIPNSLIQEPTNLSFVKQFMVKAYNFLHSWQLFPEKGTYEMGERPKSGTYKITTPDEDHNLGIEMNWSTLENQAFSFSYCLIADGEIHNFTDKDIADESCVRFIDHSSFEILFLREGEEKLKILHEIMPNGFLKVMEHGYRQDGTTYTNTSVYHKQMSVLPYSSSVSGAVIRPTEEGMIRHKALTAMEEQTNMQLQQIKQQIDLLAIQAQEIQKRKELSMVIYATKLNFSPVIGQRYYLYEKKDGSHLLSLVSPKEWGGTGPFKRCIGCVKLLADHTWVESE